MPRSSRRRLAPLAALAAAAAVAWAAPAGADLDGERFTSGKKWGVTIDAPKNWKLSEERSYPSILLWMVRRDPPGKMLLSAELVPDADSTAYATRTAELLTTLGFTVGKPQLHSATGASRIDFDDGRVFLTQAFLVAGGIGYSLTLSAPDRRTRGQHFRAFDYALRAIRIRRGPRPRGDSEGEAAPPAPAPPAPTAPPTPTPPTPTPSADAGPEVPTP